MKKILILIAVLSVFFVCTVYSQDFSGLPLPSLGTLPENMKVNPYVQVGFQHVASNINLPVRPEGGPLGFLHIGDLNLEVQDANFWTGIAGVNVKFSEMFSLFTSAGGILGRQFITPGEVPITLGGQFTASPTVDFSATNAEAWFIQTGATLGPVLLGLYWDHFGIEVGDPRIGSVPLANQTLRGDLLTKTFCPFIGIAIPASGAMATIVYSPLAWSNTTLALRSSGTVLEQLQYKWNKPGNFLSGTLQYNMTLKDSVSFGLWGSGAWMVMRGNANLESQTALSATVVQREVTATLTRYVLQGGFTLGITF
jgi:hypothetical protein